MMTPTNHPATPPQPSQPATPEFQEAHLSDYIRVILRRKKTFFLAFVTIFVAVAVYTFVTSPIYESSATLYVKDDKGKGGALAALMMESANPINAEIEIVRSRTIAEKVVDRLHLDWSTTPEKKRTRIKLLEFATSTLQVDYKLHLDSRTAYTVSDQDGKRLGQGTVGQLFTSPTLSLLVAELAGEPGDSVILRLLPRSETADRLRQQLKVSELGTKTNIIKITYAGTDPNRTSDVVNAVVQAYLDQTILFKTEEASRTVNFVGEQLKGVRQDLERAEGELQNFKSASGIVKLDSEAEETIRLSAETERERVATALQIRLVEFSLDALKEALRNGKSYAPVALKGDPLIATLAGKLADLEVQKESLLTDLTADHPQVRTTQNQIVEVLHKIRATYESYLHSLSRQERELAQRLARYEGELKRLPSTERELARHVRLAKVNADIFTFLLQKHEEARIAQASTISNIKIVDPAVSASRPVKPNKLKNLILGLLVGIMAGVGLAFFHEYMDDAIKDADEAKRLLGWPLLGIVPFIKVTNGGGREVSPHLISAHSPKSLAAEAFRAIRTSLHFSSAKRQNKIVMVTSCFPGEGKTTSSTNLAIVMAQTGSRVLLIGCDLRRPTLHLSFGLPEKPGLAEVLVGDCPVEEALHKTDIDGLVCLCGGTIPPHPAELLGSEQMVQLLKEQQQFFDIIVLDAPPVLAVTDAPILSELCDSIVVMLEAGRVPVKAAVHMRDILSGVNSPVAGLVINDKTHSSDSYGYYGQRYGYGYGYVESAAAVPEKWRLLSWFKRLLR